MLTNGYKVVELQYGVRRMMLNAPVSMKFKHKLGHKEHYPLNARWFIDSGMKTINGKTVYSLRVEVPRINYVFKKYDFIPPDNANGELKNFDLMVNAELNTIADLAAKEAQPLVNAFCMRECNHSDLYFYDCKRSKVLLSYIANNV